MFSKYIRKYKKIFISLLMATILPEESYMSEAEALLKKFPVLKSILFSNGAYLEEYNNMLEENQGLVLQK